jgi:hypothetical protein
LFSAPSPFFFLFCFVPRGTEEHVPESPPPQTTAKNKAASIKPNSAKKLDPVVPDSTKKADSRPNSSHSLSDHDVSTVEVSSFAPTQQQEDS